MPQDHQPLPGRTVEAGQIIGDFQIERRLGAGGMGVVYAAVQRSLKRRVALKVLGAALTRQADIVRFQREAHAAAKLNHPGIATIHFVGQDDELCYLAMELIEGPSLRQVIDCLASATNPSLGLDSVVQSFRSRQAAVGSLRFDVATETRELGKAHLADNVSAAPITPEAATIMASQQHLRRCCDIVSSLTDALAHAHEKGVIHRDIKPENILIGYDGLPRLIDFGMARFFEDATVTRTGQLVGTPMYMSPEQVTARVHVDHRTDIYSMGLVLYEILSLRSPIPGETREGILRGVVTKPLLPLRRLNGSVSPDLESVTHKATAKDPDERYQAAAELARELDQVTHGRPVKAPQYRFKLDTAELLAGRPPILTILSSLLYFLALVALMIVALDARRGLSAGRLSFPNWPWWLLGVALAVAGVLSGDGLLRGRRWCCWMAYVLFGGLATTALYASLDTLQELVAIGPGNVAVRLYALNALGWGVFCTSIVMIALCGSGYIFPNVSRRYRLHRFLMGGFVAISVLVIPGEALAFRLQANSLTERSTFPLVSVWDLPPLEEHGFMRVVSLLTYLLCAGATVILTHPDVLLWFDRVGSYKRSMAANAR